MNIAYLINQYPQASQSFIRREIAALESLGHQVHRFTVRRWDQPLVDPGDKAEQDKTRVILDAGAAGLLLALLNVACTRPMRFLRALRMALRLARGGERGLLYHLVYLAEACVVLPWISRCGATHVHAHFGTNSTTVALLVQELGGPSYSFTCHGPEEFDRPLALKLGEKIRHARFVVAVSEFGRSQLYRWCDASCWSRIHVVHCGLGPDFLSWPVVPLPDVPRLVCVGRLCEQKGQLLLVQAAARLKCQHPNFELVLVGDGPLRQEIEHEIARYDLSDRVHITGWASNEDVRQHLLACRAMILPSFAEGLPVVLMEALAMHRPVISTYIAGIPELVAEGGSGYLIPAGSIDHLVGVMARVLDEDIEVLRNMGLHGAMHVARCHDAQVEAATLASLFETGSGQEDSHVPTDNCRSRPQHVARESVVS